MFALKFMVQCDHQLIIKKSLSDLIYLSLFFLFDVKNVLVAEINLFYLFYFIFFFGWIKVFIHLDKLDQALEDLVEWVWFLK